MKRKILVALMTTMVVTSLVGCGKNDKNKPINAEHPEVDVSLDMTDMTEQANGVLPSGYSFNIPDGYRVDKVYNYDSHNHEDTKDTYYFDVLLHGDTEGEATGKMRIGEPCIYKLNDDINDTVIQVMDVCDPETFGLDYNDINNYKEVKTVTTDKGNTLTIYELNGVTMATNKDNVFIFNSYSEKSVESSDFEAIIVNNF